MNELNLVGTRSGLRITNCLEKLREFCTNDAYPIYDLVGYQYAGTPDVFQPELLSAVNTAMRARSKRAAWLPFLGATLPALAAIPNNIDLIEASDEDYAKAKGAVGDCIHLLASAKWITDMAASKMLYLKRPQLIAISDSYVREALDIQEPQTKTHPWRGPYCSARALAVMDAIREVGRATLDVLAHLQSRLLGRSEIAKVSNARIIDILVWADMAMIRHIRWKALAMQNRWDTIAGQIVAI